MTDNYGWTQEELLKQARQSILLGTDLLYAHSNNHQGLIDLLNAAHGKDEQIHSLIIALTMALEMVAAAENVSSDEAVELLKQDTFDLNT